MSFHLRKGNLNKIKILRSDKKKWSLENSLIRFRYTFNYPANEFPTYYRIKMFTKQIRKIMQLKESYLCK